MTLLSGDGCSLPFFPAILHDQWWAPVTMKTGSKSVSWAVVAGGGILFFRKVADFAGKVLATMLAAVLGGAFLSGLVIPLLLLPLLVLLHALRWM